MPKLKSRVFRLLNYEFPAAAATGAVKFSGGYRKFSLGSEAVSPFAPNRATRLPLVPLEDFVTMGAKP